MNLNIKQVSGSILSVSQFTLYADTKRGNLPGFDRSAHPDIAREYWLKFNELLRQKGIDVKEGTFGAHMEVNLINDGPVKGRVFDERQSGWRYFKTNERF